MLHALIEYLSGALGEIASVLSPDSSSLTPQPGELFKARAKVTVRAYIRGCASESFDTSVSKAMTVQVSEDHLSGSGDVLATIHTDGHVAHLLRKLQAKARAHGYLVVIPAVVLKKSFRHVGASPR